MARKIHCRNCRSMVPAADINITALLAKCSKCDNVFSISDSQTDPQTDAPPSRPSGVIHETGYADDLILSRRWFHVALFGLLFFCIAWDAFLVFWYSIALFGVVEAGGMGWLMIVFPIGHVAVGVGLTYYVAAGFLNRTTVTVDFEKVTVKHGPIPWKGNVSLLRQEILEIELEFGGLSANSISTELPMTISAHHQDGRQVVLVKSIPQRQAEYIAWHLVDALDVELVRKAQSLNGGQLPGILRALLPGITARRN